MSGLAVPVSIIAVLDHARVVIIRELAVEVALEDVHQRDSLVVINSDSSSERHLHLLDRTLLVYAD